MSHKIISFCCCCCLENISKYCYSDFRGLLERSNGIRIPHVVKYLVTDRFYQANVTP